MKRIYYDFLKEQLQPDEHKIHQVPVAFIPTINQICEALDEVTKSNKAVAKDQLKDKYFQKKQFKYIKIGGQGIEELLDRIPQNPNEIITETIRIKRNGKIQEEWECEV